MIGIIYKRRPRRLSEPPGQRGSTCKESTQRSSLSSTPPQIDHEAVAAQVERLIADGIDGIVACGTMGEAEELDASERAEVLRTVIDAAAGRVPVCAGISAAIGAQAVARSRPSHRARRRQPDGAAAAICTTPTVGNSWRSLRAVAGGHRAAAHGLQQPGGDRRRACGPTCSRRLRQGAADGHRDQGDPRATRGASPSCLTADRWHRRARRRRRLGAGGMPARRCRLGLRCRGGGAGGVRAALGTRPHRTTAARPAALRRVAAARASGHDARSWSSTSRPAMDELGLHGGPCRPPRLPLTEPELELLRSAVAAVSTTSV